MPANQDRARIEFGTRSPEGLVGNGRSVVRVKPDAYEFHTGGDGRGRFTLRVNGAPWDLASTETGSTFFPGGVLYERSALGVTVQVLHGALADVPYFVAIRVKGAIDPVALEVESSGSPSLVPAGSVPIPLQNGVGETALAAGGALAREPFDDLRRALEAPYETGLRLETPSPALDRSVPFCRFLLDLGVDGNLHVCEIFRWRDVWSRDLGSGLVPGAMASGRFAAARTTIAYDLRRHAAADPRGLKTTQDPSQGGTAEGVAWLARAVWQDYLLFGDRSALEEAVEILGPWVDAWIDRDSEETGLLIDVSEWMDHSRFFLFPDGARVLYSNVLFAELLHRFGKMEAELGHANEAERYAGVGDRFVQGINANLWNERGGRYDNLTLWGRRDERVAAAENALAVLCGVAPEARARRALDAVRAMNWRKAGSTTIYPPMTHVPEYIDHNYKVWPWWNAVEARARFRIGDLEGGQHLLRCCAATLEDEHYPGMMEELTSPEGATEGGFAFLTAAGSYLDAIVGGLLGVEILEPGCARIRVEPKMPAEWEEWSAEVPLPEGSIKLRFVRGTLEVEVTDPRVRVIEVPRGARVTGAQTAPLSDRSFPGVDQQRPAGLAPLLPPRPRTAAVIDFDGAPDPGLDGLPARRVSPDALPLLDPKQVDALIVRANALPRATPAGTDVRAALTRFLDGGGALVFFGATMHDRGTMGEQGGVIDWYEERPLVRYEPIHGWRFRRSFERASVPRDEERGIREEWYRAEPIPESQDTSWVPMAVPGTWESGLGYDYDGWGWYRAAFTIPEEARGKVVVLDLGRIDDEDWTYLNGQFLGAMKDWQAIRRYRIRPGEAAYGALRFGEDNLIAVQVRDTGGGGGLFADMPRVGTETGEVAWSPVDPRSGEPIERPARHGVVSWGPGGAFFNSWETSRGAFGFKIDGHGVQFTGCLAGLAPQDVDVREAFTDFAVSRPWRFEPLAFATTYRHLLVPDHGERYPCAARLVNTVTGGEIYLIGDAAARSEVGTKILARIGIRD